MDQKTSLAEITVLCAVRGAGRLGRADRSAKGAGTAEPFVIWGNNQGNGVAARENSKFGKMGLISALPLIQPSGFDRFLRLDGAARED